MPKHFGLMVREGQKGLRLKRENYAIVNKKNSLKSPGIVFVEGKYDDESCDSYTNEWCEIHKQNCLDNFDINMERFASIDREIFDKEIKHFVSRNSFIEVEDLNEYKESCGCYLLVLDDYSQAYIGKSINITKRIRQHWTATKQFDRLLFPQGAVQSSCMSIDSFRAFDTTRIFVFLTEEEKLFEAEKYFVENLPNQYLLNRIGSGEMRGALDILLSMKIRHSEDYIYNGVEKMEPPKGFFRKLLDKFFEVLKFFTESS